MKRGEVWAGSGIIFSRSALILEVNKVAQTVSVFLCVLPHIEGGEVRFRYDELSLGSFTSAYQYVGKVDLCFEVDLDSGESKTT